MKSIAIIGSTGSIGKTSLKIYLQNKKNFDLKCLAANSNLKKRSCAAVLVGAYCIIYRDMSPEEA